MRYLLLPVLLLLSATLPAADEFKVIKLEQDVRNLERQVQTLQRQVDELRRRTSRADDVSSAPLAASTSESATAESAWLDVSKWNRLRPGMGELEVIAALGPPTTMRQEGDTRLLLYALEIGSSGFLSGSVSLRDRAVVEVSKPVLK